MSFAPFPVFAKFFLGNEQDQKRSRLHVQMYNLSDTGQDKKDRMSKPRGCRADSNKSGVTARKIEVGQNPGSIDTGPSKMCPLHKTNHSLNTCRRIKAKSIEERRKFIKENKISFNCFESGTRTKPYCTATVNCADCGSDSHPTALHITYKTLSSPPAKAHGGEDRRDEVTDSSPADITCTSKCTQIHAQGCQLQRKVVLDDNSLRAHDDCLPVLDDR